MEIQTLQGKKTLIIYDLPNFPELYMIVEEDVRKILNKFHPVNLINGDYDDILKKLDELNKKLWK